MEAHSSRVAFMLREQGSATSVAESAARDFKALLAIFERYQARFVDDPHLSLAAAQRAAECGLALCNQLFKGRRRQ